MTFNFINIKQQKIVLNIYISNIYITPNRNGLNLLNLDSFTGFGKISEIFYVVGIYITRIFSDSI